MTAKLLVRVLNRRRHARQRKWDIRHEYFLHYEKMVRYFKTPAQVLATAEIGPFKTVSLRVVTMWRTSCQT